jgi:hypothetical protein
MSLSAGGDAQSRQLPGHQMAKRAALQTGVRPMLARLFKPRIGLNGGAHFIHKLHVRSLIF